MRIMAKAAAQTRTASKAPLSLKVTLYGTKPPVWRRLLIPGEMTLGDLHQAIQAAMGWDGGHLHAFDIAGRQYGDCDSLDEVADEERLTLNKVRNTGVSRFTYTYDLGDNWGHTVLIERPRRLLEAGRYPACIAGKRRFSRSLRALGAVRRHGGREHEGGRSLLGRTSSASAS